MSTLGRNQKKLSVIKKDVFLTHCYKVLAIDGVVAIAQDSENDRRDMAKEA